MRHPYEDVRLKINWADKHIGDFINAAARFMKTNPYGVVVEHDADTGQKAFAVKTVTPIPPQISLIAGDALQNLRGALDYLACGLVRMATKSEPSKYVCFPISESEPLTNEQKSAFTRQVEGMRQDAVEAIQRLKPYKGGDNTLWRLHRLNIIDKHRLLMAAATCVSRINQGFSTHMVDYMLGFSDTAPVPAHTLLDRFPLKAGDKFPFDATKPQMDQSKQFMLEIAFNEPGISKGEVIVAILKDSSRHVQQIARDLLPFMY